MTNSKRCLFCSLIAILSFGACINSNKTSKPNNTGTQKDVPQCAAESSLRLTDSSLNNMIQFVGNVGESKKAVLKAKVTNTLGAFPENFVKIFAEYGGQVVISESAPKFCARASIALADPQKIKSLAENAKGLYATSCLALVGIPSDTPNKQATTNTQFAILIVTPPDREKIERIVSDNFSSFIVNYLPRLSRAPNGMISINSKQVDEIAKIRDAVGQAWFSDVITQHRKAAVYDLAVTLGKKPMTRVTNNLKNGTKKDFDGVFGSAFTNNSGDLKTSTLDKEIYSQEAFNKALYLYYCNKTAAYDEKSAQISMDKKISPDIRKHSSMQNTKAHLKSFYPTTFNLVEKFDPYYQNLVALSKGNGPALKLAGATDKLQSLGDVVRDPDASFFSRFGAAAGMVVEAPRAAFNAFNSSPDVPTSAKVAIDVLTLPGRVAMDMSPDKTILSATSDALKTPSSDPVEGLQDLGTAAKDSYKIGKMVTEGAQPSPLGAATSAGKILYGDISAIAQTPSSSDSKDPAKTDSPQPESEISSAATEQLSQTPTPTPTTEPTTEQTTTEQTTTEPSTENSQTNPQEQEELILEEQPVEQDPEENYEETEYEPEPTYDDEE